MKRIGIFFCLLAACAKVEQPQSEKWTLSKAQAWSSENKWLVGCNFIPSTAINQLEMWQEDTFDPETIDRELGWAASIGFNSVRVYLHDLVWTHDAEGLLQRMDHFLSIAEKHDIGVLFVLLDGVWNPEPKYGKQPDPKPFTHNSGWVQSPGKAILGDSSKWHLVEEYVQGVIRHFRDDPRIHGWDLFNEPDNKFRDIDLENKQEMALLLLRKTFSWVRAVDPAQPLTAGVWYGSWHPDSLNNLNRYMIEQSDVISFHSYGAPETSQDNIRHLLAYGRPLLCTEYVARGNNNNFETMLPFFKEHGIGAYNWGLVNGKSQTIWPWDSWSKVYTDEPELWHHDIFRQDGSAYRESETELIKSLTMDH